MDAEEIARVLGQVARDNEINCTGPGEVGCKGRRGWHSWSEHRAHVAQSQAELLAPLVEQAKREAAAEIWDDGFKAGQGSMLVSAGGETRTNPYRAEQAARGGAGGGA